MSHKSASDPPVFSPATPQQTDSEQAIVIPLIAEELDVSKRVVETGIVRMTKHTAQHTETIDTPLKTVQWHVEHVPRNTVVPEAPAIRQEGETTIYPVIEERLTVIREIILVEEVRVTRSTTTRQETSSHVLTRETLTEERIPVSVET